MFPTILTINLENVCRVLVGLVVILQYINRGKLTNLVQEQVLLDTVQALPLLQKNKIEKFIYNHAYFHMYIQLQTPTLTRYWSFSGLCGFPSRTNPTRAQSLYTGLRNDKA